MPDKNMKKIIFGITDLADVLFYELMAAGENIDAFCVNRQYITDTMHLGRKVVAYEDINDIYDVHELGCYIAVGYNSMNDARKKIYHELKEMEIKVLSFVHSSAVVMAERVGEGCLIFEHAILGPYSQAGICNIFYPKSMLSHHSVAGDFNFFAISCSVAGNVTVGNNCFIGNNAATKDGIHIADYTLVGAGSYLAHDTGEKECVVPARSVTIENHISTDFL